MFYHHFFSENLRVPLNGPPPPWNKALLRPHSGTMMVKSPLIKGLISLEGRGTRRFSWLPFKGWFLPCFFLRLVQCGWPWALASHAKQRFSNIDILPYRRILTKKHLHLKHLKNPSTKKVMFANPSGCDYKALFHIFRCLESPFNPYSLDMKSVDRCFFIYMTAENSRCMALLWWVQSFVSTSWPAKKQRWSKHIKAHQIAKQTWHSASVCWFNIIV